MAVTVICEAVHEVDGAVVDGQVLIAPDALEAALGWTLKPHGLCRDDICMPVRQSDAVTVGDKVSVEAVARKIGRQSVCDLDAAIIAIGLAPEERTKALIGLHAPDFTLDDLEGEKFSLRSLRGRKVVLVAFASWCGCRYDLPGWQALDDQFADQGLSVVTIALDEDPADVRPFTEGITIPVLLDRGHLTAELYAMSNVPTVIWIDEGGRIAKPNTLGFSTDTFADFTGHRAAPTLEAIAAWVRGEVTEEPAHYSGAVSDLSDDEVSARLHFRIGAELRRRGDDAGARRHFDVASALAPIDWTVRRAAMPLSGRDPFGQEFLDLYDAWQQDGAPYHGLSVEGG